MFWQRCDSVLTALWQCCDRVVTVLWQHCNSVVTILWQCCNNVVTVLLYFHLPRELMVSIELLKASLNWSPFIISITENRCVVTWLSVGCLIYAIQLNPYNCHSIGCKICYAKFFWLFLVIARPEQTVCGAGLFPSSEQRPSQVAVTVISFCKRLLDHSK